MKTATFKQSGVIYSRGEDTGKTYRAGDQVTVMQKLTEDLFQVLIMDGESKGTILSIDKKLLNYKTMEFKID